MELPQLQHRLREDTINFIVINAEALMISEYQTIYHRADCSVYTTCIAVPHKVLQKLTAAQWVSTLPAFHGTPRFTADSEELAFVPLRNQMKFCPHSQNQFL
jgi:hypothetical protein